MNVLNSNLADVMGTQIDSARKRHVNNNVKLIQSNKLIPFRLLVLCRTSIIHCQNDAVKAKMLVHVKDIFKTITILPMIISASYSFMAVVEAIKIVSIVLKSVSKRVDRIQPIKISLDSESINRKSFAISKWKLVLVTRLKLNGGMIQIVIHASRLFMEAVKETRIVSKISNNV